MKKTSLVGWNAILLCAFALVYGCAPATEAPSQTEATAATAAAEPELRLPVSLNDVMVALVNYAADPIWVAAWNDPQTDKDWRDLSRNAYQLEIAGALLRYPGTGPLDDEWVAQEGWGEWADQLREVGADAVGAVNSRNKEVISKVGDRIVEVCEGCHADYKLDMPTGGKFGELSPTAADLEDEE